MGRMWHNSWVITSCIQ